MLYKSLRGQVIWKGIPLMTCQRLKENVSRNEIQMQRFLIEMMCHFKRHLLWLVSQEVGQRLSDGIGLTSLADNGKITFPSLCSTHPFNCTLQKTSYSPFSFLDSQSVWLTLLALQSENPLLQCLIASHEEALFSLCLLPYCSQPDTFPTSMSPATEGTPLGLVTLVSTASSGFRTLPSEFPTSS